MRHSVCESALNEMALDSTRKTFKEKPIFKDGVCDYKESIEKGNEEVGTISEYEAEQRSQQSILHRNSLKKCKKLLLSIGQKNKNK